MAKLNVFYMVVSIHCRLCQDTAVETISAKLYYIEEIRMLTWDSLLFEKPFKYL